ncbi:MAG: hypothetical protein A2Z14_11320 [Chloroflexi bacterium RBG_16_48_8]|nr:MAG: hypothetical protein A2Z14_11320 [Chloroflexi bacterium RBG_16_48_8]
MLPIIGITVLIIFIILWRSGILDDLQKGRLYRQRGRENQESKQLTVGSSDSDMNKRLEVFKEFIDELPDDEIEE